VATRGADAAQKKSLRTLLGEGRRLRDQGKPEAALDAYGRALQAEPENPDALAGRGLCYLDLSRYVPAEEAFKAALAANDVHPAALMGLAETYRYEGRRADAVTYYRRYLAAHPRGEDAAAARNAIQSLEERP
jgi:tetratricopeptide (TPR) repeat protein